MMFKLTIDKGGLLQLSELESKKVIGAAANMKQFHELIRNRVKKGDRYLVSSSIDFPEEYTSRKQVIAICRKIRHG